MRSVSVWSSGLRCCCERVCKPAHNLPRTDDNCSPFETEWEITKCAYSRPSRLTTPMHDDTVAPGCEDFCENLPYEGVGHHEIRLRVDGYAVVRDGSSGAA